MVLRGRRRDLAEMSEGGYCPSPDTFADHKDWGWRFVAALASTIDGGDPSPLATLAEQARHPFEAVACRVVGACAAAMESRSGEALTWLAPGGEPARVEPVAGDDKARTSAVSEVASGLDAVQDGDQSIRVAAREGADQRELSGTTSGTEDPSGPASPTAAGMDERQVRDVERGADTGWVLAHRAHMQVELEQPNEEAAQTAVDALLALKWQEGDATAAALRGSCAALLPTITGVSAT